MTDLIEPVGKNYSRNNLGQRKKSDLYETPYSMTSQLLAHEFFEPGIPILEPAAGNGAIVHVLEDAGFIVESGDISSGQDFLARKTTAKQIITNPPYRMALEFILQAKRICTWKFAFLLPTDYLHGIERLQKVFLDDEFPLATVWIFSRRPMLGDPLRDDGKYRTGMQTYGWFVWDRSHHGRASIDWINNQQYVIGGRP